MRVCLFVCLKMKSYWSRPSGGRFRFRTFKPWPYACNWILRDKSKHQDSLHNCFFFLSVCVRKHYVKDPTAKVLLVREKSSLFTRKLVSTVMSRSEICWDVRCCKSLKWSKWGRNLEFTARDCLQVMTEYIQSGGLLFRWDLCVEKGTCTGRYFDYKQYINKQTI